MHFNNLCFLVKAWGCTMTYICYSGLIDVLALCCVFGEVSSISYSAYNLFRFAKLTETEVRQTMKVLYHYYVMLLFRLKGQFRSINCLDKTDFFIYNASYFSIQNYIVVDQSFYTLLYQGLMRWLHMSEVRCLLPWREESFLSKTNLSEATD